MFPIPWNKAFRKKDGSVVNIADAMSGGGGGSDLPPHSSTDAGKVLTVGEDGTLEWDEAGSGGGEYAVLYDFTKYGTRTIKGVNYSTSGASFPNLKCEISLLPKSNDFTLYVDTGAMPLTADQNRRFIMASSTQGFVFRNTGAWGFYDVSDTWEMTEISDGAFFSNSTVKIYIDNSNKWHIYKNGTLIFEPKKALPIEVLTIGCENDYSIQGAIITGARLYNGNYTE